MATSSPSPAITKHDLETRLIEKCWKEPEFRKQVLADPKGTFERHFGRPLPADIKIVIHEDTPKTINFTLPQAPANVQELSDDELEKVAGGTDVVATIMIAAVVTVGAAVSLGVGAGAAAATGKSPW